MVTYFMFIENPRKEDPKGLKRKLGYKFPHFSNQRPKIFMSEIHGHLIS